VSRGGPLTRAPESGYPARMGEPETRSAAAGAAVRITGVRRVFRAPGEADVVAVDGLDLAVAPGEFVAIIGPSGCGKSTLLRMIAGLERVDEGSIEVDRSAIAYVFQDAHLLPWRTVLDNAALPLELLGLDTASCRSAARRAIESVGLGDAAPRYPAQLSGGMRMRVSLARALVTEPRLLLLDEPFAALDEITRQGLDDQLRALWRATGTTVLFVTHSIAEAAYLAERAVVLTRRPARVVLEQRLDLPEDRTPELRGDARFAAETRVLYDALRRGSEPAA
jgi:NitT/TauT family transport system ATP-binding protein